MTDINQSAGFTVEDGVLVSGPGRSKFLDFENKYIAVREKEGRVLSLDEIRALPFISKEHPDYELWKIRRHNIKRFFKYISDRKNLKILDVGCGNGFFSNLCQTRGHVTTGLDINLHELKQAAQAFPGSGINWLCTDLFSDAVPEKGFDIITFCCSFQYFNDPKKLIDRCLKLLDPKGEIHIIDTPFYTPESVENARLRSAAYYDKMGSSEMDKYYHHHTLEELSTYNVALLYRPGRLTKLLGDSPFPWIKIVH